MIALEIFTAFIGILLAYDEVVRNRFRNFATSVFLVCFVPLFCIYPVIARLLIDGAYSVQPGDYLVFSDYAVYLIYQSCCLGILAMVYVSRAKTLVETSPKWQSVAETTFGELMAAIGIISLGIFLYVRSTGFSVTELFAASRFEWFNNTSYSPAAFVVSTYLMALSPVVIFLAARNKSYRWLVVVVILELVFFGALSKDRKWLIYILSSGFAIAYYYQGFTIKLRKGFVIAGLTIVVALAFWQILRSVVFQYVLTGNGDVYFLAQEMAVELLTRGDFPYYYNASITAINMNFNYDFSIPLGLLSRQFLFFLPAGYSFGLKIEDISALFSDALDAGDSVRRGNMPPGLFGLFVLSFGWLGGILTCSLIPFLLRFLDRYIQRANGIGSFVVASHFMSATLLALRGDDSSATYFIVFSMVVFALLRPSTIMRRHEGGYARGQSA